MATLILATPFTETARAGDALRRLRTTLLPDTVGRVPGADYAVGGVIAVSIDYTDHLKQRLPWVIGFVLALTFVVMVATFRSVVVGLATIALNVVSVGASFGFVVLVFQRRWAEHLHHCAGRTAAIVDGPVR